MGKLEGNMNSIPFQLLLFRSKLFPRFYSQSASHNKLTVIYKISHLYINVNTFFWMFQSAPKTQFSHANFLLKVDTEKYLSAKSPKFLSYCKNKKLIPSLDFYFVICIRSKHLKLQSHQKRKSFVHNFFCETFQIIVLHTKFLVNFTDHVYVFPQGSTSVPNFFEVFSLHLNSDRI